MSLRTVRMLPLIFSLICATPVLGQDECCPDRTHSTSLEGWFLHNGTYIGFTYWTSNKSNTSLAIGPGAPLILRIKAATLLRQTCTFDIHLLGILGLPLGTEMSWQNLDLGVGAELCFLSVPEFAIEIAGGFYLYHYRGSWGSGTFTLLCFKLYL